MEVLNKKNYGSDSKRPIDEELIFKIGNGDMDALRNLYEAVSVSVYGFVLSIVKSKDDADDVLQDTFLKIYSNAADYRAKGKPLAWIFTIARNAALSRLRERSRTDSFENSQSEPIDFSSVENTEQRILLEMIFKNLADEEQQILMLHAVSGMKYREIASFMDIPLNTVLSKYHRAAKKIKERITEE